MLNTKKLHLECAIFELVDSKVWYNDRNSSHCSQWPCFMVEGTRDVDYPYAVKIEFVCHNGAMLCPSGGGFKKSLPEPFDE